MAEVNVIGNKENIKGWIDEPIQILKGLRMLFQEVNFFILTGSMTHVRTLSGKEIRLFLHLERITLVAGGKENEMPSAGDHEFSGVFLGRGEETYQVCKKKQEFCPQFKLK
jgi:hypothetical protein